MVKPVLFVSSYTTAYQSSAERGLHVFRGSRRSIGINLCEPLECDGAEVIIAIGTEKFVIHNKVAGTTFDASKALDRG
ncbi:uncharacterized protein CC84DRAFT_586019 [Paraphaeosphaeria sporulosa]|uniref:Uncharacterized protein n=1 Tax=Paraphaeosphaeria sporulosa TaxID=1460663 RepID=A0A177CMH7_9PLEO|nr:uncharacterized protein CC84DRAFT_586019 [Paraphaeosphaeria sporulosa]OAG08735.1 hypothetical protein CC84DRAFT_586019 [Paraphaeosphaeria sporulosa]